MLNRLRVWLIEQRIDRTKFRIAVLEENVKIANDHVFEAQMDLAKLERDLGWAQYPERKAAADADFAAWKAAKDLEDEPS